jgi:hypothetical protein
VEWTARKSQPKTKQVDRSKPRRSTTRGGEEKEKNELSDLFGKGTRRVRVKVSKSGKKIVVVVEEGATT